MRSQKSTSGKGKNRWLKFVRFYLEQSMKLCQANPAGSREGFGPPVERSQLPRWSLALQAFYVYFTLKLFIALVLQHRINVLAMKISTLDMREKTTGPLLAANDTWHMRRHALQLDYDEASRRSRTIGNALYELGFAAEPPVICALVFFYISYLHIRVYNKLGGRVSLATLRMLLDPEREHARLARSEIGKQASSFIASSEHFWLVQRDKILGAYRWPRESNTGRAERFSPEFLKELREPERAHRRAVSAVRELAASGQLVPLNRRVEWLTQLAQTSGLLIIAFLLLGLGMYGAILIMFRFQLHADRPRDLLFVAEHLFYDAMGLACICFYLIILILSALDQVEFVVQLSRLIRELTRDIAAGQQRQPSQECQMVIAWRSSQTTCSAFTRRLMRALILHRQLISQVHACQPFMGFVGAHTALITIFVCALDRAYAPYMALEFRYIYLVTCLFIILCCDFLIVPNCLLHARCLQLFKSMYSLMAHIDAHEEQMRQLLTSQRALAASKLGSIDKHTVWLLRKLLHTPEAAARRLATSAYGLQLTYSSFLGIHFWCGLLIAPLLLKDTAHLSANGNLLGGRLRIV